MRIALGVGLAGDPAVAVSAAERVARQLLGGGAIGFGKQRGDALGIGLVLEAVDEIFGRKLVGGTGLVSQKIPYRVIVLTVRQPSHHDLRRFRQRRRLRCVRGGLRQVTHPIE